MTTPQTDVQKTALFEKHKVLGGRMVEFAGWSMPAFYSDVKSEHLWVREKCGIFDVSHMGQFFISGQGAEEFLNFLLTNNCASLKNMGGQYTLLLNSNGGIIDDWIIYKLGVDTYLACVNASRVSRDWEWISIQQRSNKIFNHVKLVNASDRYSQLAVQGPLARDVMSQILETIGTTQTTLDDFKKMRYMSILPLEGSLFGAWNAEKAEGSYLARTGYTGELGYEIYLPHALATVIWDKALSNSIVKPIGLGARDTLRLEVCYHLYGQDMDETVQPQDADLNWVVKTNKAVKFCGQSAIESSLEKSGGVSNYAFCGFQMIDKGIARSGMNVLIGSNPEPVGKVTSAGPLPSAGFSGGLCRIERKYLSSIENLYIDLRGDKRQIKIVDKPLFHAKVKESGS